jgi:two-component system, NtrC family, sensor kinase
MSATPDRTLADLQQSNADLRRELADLRGTLDERTHERDEALQRETATAEVLQVINSSPGNLAPVFDAMLEKALHVCKANFGTMFLYDGGKDRSVAVRGAPEFARWMAERDAVEPTPGSLGDRLKHGENVVHILDASKEAAYESSATRRAVVEIGGFRTLLAVALRKGDDPLGGIVVYRREVCPFSDKQIALLQNFAAQAVIAMENARLITETREALEQQTATAEVLGVINSSPGDLAPVFDALLEKAMRLCGAAHGTLTAYDGKHFRCVASHNLPDALFELLNQPRVAGPDSAQERLLQGECIVHIADMQEMVSPDDQFARIGFTRTILFVALRKDSTLLGYISAQRQEVRPFTEKQIALLQNFAAQAVIAMENARLITETHEALEQQTATAEVLQVINSSPGDLAPVFDAMLEKALSLCGASFGSFGTYDGECFHVVASRGHVEFDAWARQRGPARPEPGTTVGRIAQGERVVQILDIADDEAYRKGASSFRRALVEIGGFRTLLTLALRKDDALRGYLHVYRQEVRPFTDKQIALLQNFAEQAVIAMENARLLGELRQRNDEIAGWNRELETRVAAQLAELERTGKLRRFLAPQLADLIIAQGDESILESHRREIVVVFCDVRGFTAFAERAEPEEVMAFLRDYHAALGPIVAHFEGTLDHYSGDGVMVFFNDPLPTPEPAKQAIEMAIEPPRVSRRLQLLRGWSHDEASSPIFR